MTEQACLRSGRVVLAAAALVVATTVLVVASAAPASAHASLRSSTPGDGEAVAEAPAHASFTFNEPVEVTTGALRVFDAAGARVDDARQRQPAPDTVSVGLDDLDDGGYVATFRVTSADGHVIRGAITFRVGDGAALDDDTVAALFGGGDGAVAILARVIGAVDLGAALVAVGALVAAVGAAVGHRHRRLARTTARSAAVVGMAATVLVVPVQAMATSGLGLAALGSSAAMGDALTSSVGIAASTRLAGLLLVVASVAALARPGDRRLPRPGVGVAGAAVLVLGSLLLDGHTRTVEPAWLMLLGDAVHVAAAATWAGGLVVLARVLRSSDPVGAPLDDPLDDIPDASPVPRRVVPAAVPAGPGPTESSAVPPDDPTGRSGAGDPGRAVADARALARFSGRALWTMVALVLAGSMMAWALVRQPRALTSTDYGWTLVAKVAVVVVILLVAAYNRWRLVPAVVAAGPEAAVGRRQVRNTVRSEVALLLVVVGITAVLTNLRPAADAAGISGAFDTVVELTATTSVNLVVDPNRAGVNQVHVYVLDDTGRPLDDADEVSLELTQLDQDIGPIEREPLPSGPGHWILTGSELAVPGTWEITTVVGIDRFTEERATVEVVVNPA